MRRAVEPLTLHLAAIGLLAGFTPLGLTAIVFVTNDGRARNGYALAIGWGAVLAAMAGLCATVLHDRLRPHHGPSRVVAIGAIVFGLGCILLAGVARLRARRSTGASGEDAGDSRLSQRLAGLGGGASIVAGAMLAPYPIGVAAGNELIQSGADTATRWTAIIVFGVCSTWSLVAATIAIARHPDASRARIEQATDWFRRHKGTILPLALALFGAYLVLRGAQALHAVSD